MFRYKRDFRTFKSIVKFPFDYLMKGNSGDNYLIKRNRIKKIQKKLKIKNFIETGTFFGQTVHFAKRIFLNVYSIEIYLPLFEYNKISFKHSSNVNLYLGDSGVILKEILPNIKEKSIFWLDGHYSGKGTGYGEKVSPIINEIRAIKNFHRNDNCILVDDYRLFGRDLGYPTFDELKNEILTINENYKIYIDSDCIVSYVE